ncbi:hypothetical protein LRS04_14980 [Phenylobacterium sp. J367]|nr:hypothetical protein [Phenylobacterium sp. J367]
MFLGVNLIPQSGVNGSNYWIGGSAGNDAIDVAAYHPNPNGNPVGANGDFGDDTLTGHSGNDRNLEGGAGADKLIGQGGDDYLVGGDGSDTIDGGAGHDSAAFRLPQGTTGTLRLVEGQQPGQIIVQLVNGSTVTDYFNVTLGDGGDAVVTGVGPMAHLGTDTVTGVEHLEFYPDGGGQPAITIHRTLNVSSGFVDGTPGADLIDFLAQPGVNLAGIINANGGLGADIISGHDGQSQGLNGGAGGRQHLRARRRRLHVGRRGQ